VSEKALNKHDRCYRPSAGRRVEESRAKIEAGIPLMT